MSRKILWSLAYDPQIMSRGGGAHEQCVTRCPVSHLAHSPGRPAIVITWKISSRDPGLARLSYNRIVDFCCVKLRYRDLCKASQPDSCNQALSYIARFYAPPDLTDLAPEHTHKISAPPWHLHTPFSILVLIWTFDLTHVLFTQILSKISEKQS